MKKILFYCQYLAGMGHLVRSREIVHSLLEDFQVCWVIGGEPIADFALPDLAEVVYLPPLREAEGELRAIDQSLEEVKASRVQTLLETFDQFQPDCVMTECFPFSKFKMSFELLPLLERAKSAEATIVCSLRDLIMTQKMSSQGQVRKVLRVHEQIRQYYDLVLIHGDRTLQSLEDCFPTAGKLDCELYYTGFVAQNPTSSKLASTASLEPQTPAIVASVGGGRDGYPLLKAVMDSAPILAASSPHQIYAFAGPFMPDSEFEALSAIAQSQSNVTFQRFTPDLLHYLSHADLSVSLAGYNTTMDVLRTGVRSLMVPSPSKDQVDEQRRRAALLDQQGIVTLLTPEQFTPEDLAQAMIQQLSRPLPIHRINLDGAMNAAKRLRSQLNQPASPRLAATPKPHRSTPKIPSFS